MAKIGEFQSTTPNFQQQLRCRLKPTDIYQKNLNPTDHKRIHVKIGLV